MERDGNYIDINRSAWNQRAEVHYGSEFYDVDGFIRGKNSLNTIELDLLGDVSSKSVLHLQCHFGQDTLSLNRLGAEVTGVDFSDTAIGFARKLAEASGTKGEFITCDLYALPQHLDRQFDIVFTTYGTIGWLPDIDQWAAIVARYLKPGGLFVFAEFHPFVWTFNDSLTEITYDYFQTTAIQETQTGTYVDRDSRMVVGYISWNHSLGEVVGSLLKNGVRIRSFEEFDYSPYNCFANMREDEPGKFRIAHIARRIPMVYALSGIRE